MNYRNVWIESYLRLIYLRISVNTPKICRYLLLFVWAISLWIICIGGEKNVKGPFKLFEIFTMKVQLDFWKRLSFRNLLTFCDKCGSLSVASPTRRQYQIFTHGSHYLPPFFLALINYGDILCKSIFRGLQIAFKDFERLKNWLKRIFEVHGNRY